MQITTPLPYSALAAYSKPDPRLPAVRAAFITTEANTWAAVASDSCSMLVTHAPDWTPDDAFAAVYQMPHAFLTAAAATCAKIPAYLEAEGDTLKVKTDSFDLCTRNDGGLREMDFATLLQRALPRTLKKTAGNSLTLKAAEFTAAATAMAKKAAGAYKALTLREGGGELDIYPHNPHTNCKACIATIQTLCREGERVLINGAAAQLTRAAAAVCPPSKAKAAQDRPLTIRAAGGQTDEAFIIEAPNSAPNTLTVTMPIRW